MIEVFSYAHQQMYMRVAFAVGLTGTCDRARVGSVIVRNSCILGTGYNGSAKGDDHCDTHGHILVGNHCIRAVHSEENAIINAARNGISTYGASLFCTHMPCYRCCQRVINAGITSVYYAQDYGSNSEEIEARRLLIEKSGLLLTLTPLATL